jgi:lysophospholipase L1-like esterase
MLAMTSNRDGELRPHTCGLGSVFRARTNFGSWAIVAVLLAAIVGVNLVSLHRPELDGRDISTTFQHVTLSGGPVNSSTAAFIGDSYTEGAGASAVEKRWSTLVSQKMGWQESNFGRGGTGYLVSSPDRPNYLGMANEVAATHPDIVVVSGGQNDMAEFIGDSGPVSEAITDTFKDLRAQLPRARIIAVGPSFPGDVTPSLVVFDSDVQRAARAVGGEYVSLIAPTPALQADMFIADNTHVDDSGHAAIADRVVYVLTHIR